MNFVFHQLNRDYSLFFDILPQDWQDDIVPFWDDYKEISCIYVIEETNKIIGGGIVFTTCAPDILYYKKEAKKWFDNGYLYLGFIWIVEDKRNMNLGSFWLDQLKKKHPKQKYWLLIEEEHLHRFYKKNGFSLNTTIKNRHHTEWLYCYTPL